MRCKKIFHLLSILFIITSSAYALDFSVCDFERLVNKHPLIRQYDPETKRFKGTPSEVQSVASITRQIASITSEIERLENLRKKLLSQSLSGSQNVSDEDMWKKVRTNSALINALKNKLVDLNDLSDRGGVPSLRSLLVVVQGITRDVMNDIRNSGDHKTIHLNKLPRYYQPAPEFKKNPFRLFIFDPDKKSSLLEYVHFAGAISLLFPMTSEPILYDERKP